MSAICGVVSQTMNEKRLKKLIKPFEKYTFDATKHHNRMPVYFSSFQQFVTRESESAILPYYDSSSECMITADAIIDNRDKLMNKLEVNDIEISDSQLILAAYIKWGDDCAKYLIGDYSFAIYNFKTDKLLLVRDPMGSRALYYRKNGNEICFSTVMESLIDEKTIINEKYVRQYIAYRSPINSVYANQTIYEDIYYISPAHVLTWQNGSVNESRYWSLTKDIKYNNFEDAIVEFDKVFNEAVTCRMRSKKEIGIMISGGLDSSAVGCYAAKISKSKERKLHTYTSTSIMEHLNKLPSLNRISYDESELVLTMKALYPNMINNFLECNQMNGYNTMEDISYLHGQPQKAIPNTYWLQAITKSAHLDGCDIVLSGAMGNYTISYGDHQRYMFHNIKKMNILKLMRDSKYFCEHKKIGRRRLYKSFIKNVFSLEVVDQNKVLNEYHKFINNEQKEVVKELHDYFQCFGPRPTYQRYLRKHMNFTILNQLAEVETRNGLEYQVRFRDPTRDVRIVEFCNQCSINVFNGGGVDRALVIKGMRGIVPDEILDSNVKGLQTADFIERLIGNWSTIYNDVYSIVKENEEFENFLNREAFLNHIKKYKDIKSGMDFSKRVDIRNILSTLQCLKFIEKFNKDKKNSF